MKLLRQYIRESILYHSTSPENVGPILSNGLKTGMSSVNTLGGAWADEIYGERPIYLSMEKGKYEGIPLAVNTSGLDLVADLPSLVDTGAYQEEEGMWWDEGSEPQQMLDIVDEDGMVYFDELLSPGSAAAQAAIDITGTAAVVQDIHPINISEKEASLKTKSSSAESDWASKSQEDKDARWRRIAFETIAMKRYRKYAQAEGIPFDPDNEEDMKIAIAWWEKQQGLDETKLRTYIRSLLREDPMGFVHDLAASDKFGDQFFGGQINKAAGREIKRAFANNADHQWLSTLHTVHWATTYDLVQLKGKNKDELSTTMTLPKDDFIPAASLEVGLWVKGRITLAANDQDTIYSGFYRDYGTKGGEGSEEEVAHRDKSSGRNKRPTVSKDYSRYGKLKRGNEYMEKMVKDNIPYVLDQSTWDLSKQGWNTHNEALVDNWKPAGIVVSLPQDANVISGLAYVEPTKEDIKEFTIGKIKQILLMALDFGVPVYDLSKNILWDPR